MKLNLNYMVLLLLATSGPYFVDLNFPLINFAQTSNNKQSYFENINSFRPSLLKPIKLREEKKGKVYPNGPEPLVLIEKLGTSGTMPLNSKTIDKPIFDTPNIIGSIPSTTAPQDFWQDTQYFLDNNLIYTKREVHNLSNGNNFLEGILINSPKSTILTSSGEKYSLVKLFNDVYNYQLDKN